MDDFEKYVQIGLLSLIREAEAIEKQIMGNADDTLKKGERPARKDDYISRKAAKNAITDQWWEEIDRVPAADVRPVVRGKWILHDNGSATCSVCKCWQKLIYDDDSYQHYCGNCGAQMEVEE